MRFVKSIDAFHDMTCSLGQSGIYLYSILVQSCTRAECASGQLNSVVCDTAVQWTAWEPYGSRSLKVQPNPKLRPQSRDGLVETAWCLHEPIQQAQHNNEIGKVQKNNKPADHNELWSGSNPYTAFGHCATTPKTRTPRQVKRNPCTTKSQLVSRSEKRAGHHHSLRGRLAKRSSILSICCWNNTSREVFCCSNCFWNWH